jgi:hypothetical protein
MMTPKGEKKNKQKKKKIASSPRQSLTGFKKITKSMAGYKIESA